MVFRVLLSLPQRVAAQELQELCRRLDCETLDCQNLKAVTEAAELGGLDVCLLALRSIHREPEILSQLASVEEAPSILVVASEEELPEALALVRAGAAGALALPCSLGALACALEQARKERIRRLERNLRERDENAPRFALLGRSREHRRVLEGVARVAGTPSTTVLLRGEPGTGKERVARAIHAESKRGQGSFVALRCATRRGMTLEEELFGRERDDKQPGLAGLLLAAQGGTLYIDEISKLEPAAQTRLAQSLNERTWRRVGSQVDLTLDTRIVASSRHDLSNLVDDGLFSEELFYPLNVLTIPIPELRERKEDIAPYAHYFLDQTRAALNTSPLSFTSDAMRTLEDYGWPGNLLELEAVVRRAAITAESGEVGLEHLALNAAVRTSDGLSLDTEDLSVRSMEKALIQHVLEVTGGNRSQAARVLQVNRATLYNKLKQYEL